MAATIVNNAESRRFMEPLTIGFFIKLSIFLTCNPCRGLLLLICLRPPDDVEVWRYKPLLHSQLRTGHMKTIGQLTSILKTPDPESLSTVLINAVHASVMLHVPFRHLG